MMDGTIAAQKAMSAILRTGERFGTEHLVSLLLGEATDAIKRFGHDALPTFGVGKEFNRNEWRSIFRQLYAAGILSLDITGYGRWTVPATSRAVLKGKSKIQLRRDTVTAPGRKEPARPRPRQRSAPARPTRRCSRRCACGARRSPKRKACRPM